MPAWLQVIADWNPFSAVAAACRQLFGNPNPSALVHAWPMQHPELAVLLWSGLLLAIFAPLAGDSPHFRASRVRHALDC
jgi:ABC-2 type transport system permease protein